MNEHPDSALQILDSLGQYEAEFGHHFRMQYLLHHTNAQSKNYVMFTSDSLVSKLAKYFDSHGTTNERVLAHYLLGLALSDMGEAPQAISSFQDAVDAADTLSADFNYATLACVYSQMAEVYHTQLLPTNEIYARKAASLYAIRANQIQWALYDQAMSANAYILLNKKDSAEIILKSALEQYREHGYTQEALRYSRALIHLYVEQPDKLVEAKQLMDQFETESNMFDANHELPPSRRQYYYYKGRYYEGVNRLDSAEFYYRKVYRPDMSYVFLDPMYRGLLSVYSKLHLADSIAKYAQLFCMVNDSSIAVKDQEIVAQMTASYNYNRIQQEAYVNEVKAYKSLLWLIITLVIMGLFFITAFVIWRRFLKSIKLLKAEFADTTEEYQEKLCELRMIESTRQKVIATIQQELKAAQGESNNYKEKFMTAQQTISRINKEYEEEKTKLLQDTHVLQIRINELQKEKVLTKYLAISESFSNEEIVRRIYEIANSRLIIVTEQEWAELTNAFGKSYSTLFLDLCHRINTPQSIRVCILTALGISNDEQANMLNTSKQRVSNIKLTLNKLLFDESSSRTLRRNLAVRYNIYGIERNNLSEKSQREP